LALAPEYILIKQRMYCPRHLLRTCYYWTRTKPSPISFANRTAFGWPEYL